MKNSNWPGGVDRSHSNYTLRFPRVSRYEGQGGWAPHSAKTPRLEAAVWVVGTAAAVWVTVQIAIWIVRTHA